MSNNHFDAVVILGGGRNRLDGSLTQLSKSRLDTGADVIKNGIADRAIVMGKVYKSYTPDEDFLEKQALYLARII